MTNVFNWIDSTLVHIIRSDPGYYYMFLYFVYATVSMNTLAKLDTRIGARIPDPVRAIFLIFQYTNSRISILCIISQIFAYAMVAIFIISQFHPPYFLYMYTSDPNEFFSGIIRIHSIIVIPVALLEGYICELKEWWRKR